MPRKPSANASPPSAVFPCCIPVQLFAELALRAKEAGELPLQPTASGFIRALLERLAGPKEQWDIQSSDSAVQILAELGFSTHQFASPRYRRCRAAEDLAAERQKEQKPRDPEKEQKLQSLTKMILEGSATSEDKVLYETLASRLS